MLVYANCGFSPEITKEIQNYGGGKVKNIDLRSDTCSQPDEGMRKAMSNAIVGNESWGEDRSVNLLIEEMSAMLGKEDGLFCCSGTMANLISAMTHKSIIGGFGIEVIMDQFSHTYWYEVSNLTTIAGISVFPVQNDGEYLNEARLKQAVRPKSDFMASSKVLWLENTYMLGGGQPISISEMKRFRGFADVHEMAIHLDGARLLNASVALGVTPSDIAGFADSVQCCLSKGLGAPFGSVLFGDKEFISKAKRCRQAIGGGLRQAGIMAAAGIYALKNYKERFQNMHRLTKVLAEKLDQIMPMCVNIKQVKSNMIFFTAVPLGLSDTEFCRRLNEYGIKAMPSVFTPYGDRIRMMIYPGITDEDIEYVLNSVKDILIKLPVK